MSWLFTIVFSGLMFSSNQGVAVDAPVAAPAFAPQVVTRQGDETEKFEQTYPMSENGRVSDNEIRFDGIQADRNDGEEKNGSENIRYRIGKGGNQFRIFTDGEILVRGHSVLTAGR